MRRSRIDKRTLWCGAGASTRASGPSTESRQAAMTQYGSAAGSDQRDDDRHRLARRFGNALILPGNLGASRFIAVKTPEQPAWDLAVQAPRSIGVGDIEQ